MAKRKVFKCEECGKDFPDHYWGANRFCSMQCSTAFKQHGRPSIACGICGKTRIISPWAVGVRKYCSRACAASGRRKHDPLAQCEICGQYFPRNSFGPNRFCSRACYFVMHSNRPRDARICPRCGETFNVLPTSHRKYCGTSCWKAKRKAQPTQCIQCAAWFTAIKFHAAYAGFISVNGYRTCSDQCLRTFYRTNEERKAKIGKAFLGKNHPNWQGGKSYLGISYRGRGWAALTERIRERAQRYCEKCGKHERELRRRLDIHHVEPFHNFTNTREANCPANLIALCQSCHRTDEKRAMQMLMPFIRSRGWRKAKAQQL